MAIWFHPQRGAVVTDEPLNRRWYRHRGGSDDAWRQILEPLPETFLRGDASQQTFGMGGPIEVFGPLERTCRDCDETFLFTAAEQKHWYETLRFNIDATAVRCLPCRKVIQHQRAYTEAVERARADPSARTHLDVARAALAWRKLGGKAPREKAVMHCRKAKQLGSSSSDSVMKAIADAWGR